MEEFTKALNEEHFTFAVSEGSLTIVEVKHEPPPTYDELLQFYHDHKDNNNAKEED